MGILPVGAQEWRLPEMFSVQQNFDTTFIYDCPEKICEEFRRKHIGSCIRKNDRVLLLVGSRGIDRLDVIVKQMGDCIKMLGAVPFIMPAMGSHGGGTIEGQVQILREYGITQDRMGIEIVCSNETSVVGTASCGTQIRICTEAMQFDHIVPIARVKPHTDFKGNIESGICKMLAIGLGKHEGCYTLHQQGFEDFPRLIPEAAQIILSRCSVPFALAIVENAYDKVCHLELVMRDEIIDREAELLKMAKGRIGRIPFQEVDVLIVEQSGKDISGAGMDPNVIGRTTRGILPGFMGPMVKQLVVLDLSEQALGNACGIGVADFTTKKLFQKIDFESTYTNAIASGNVNCARIPIVCIDEQEAILAACLSCGKVPREKIRILRIKDTLHLETMQVSKSMLEDCEKNPCITILGLHAGTEDGRETISTKGKL